MKRIERVYRALVAHCQEHQTGLAAADLAERVGAARQNVSGDLNELWRQGRVVKVPGRPVLYWSREAYEQAGRGGEAAPLPPEPAVAATGEPPAEDPFVTRLIGSEGSLKTQVEQAKAAVLYPPSGLHTLLVGPTGVGKSFMAELMHSFGVAAGRFSAGLVTLNCADFAQNPQLLLGHLFGVKKGAYTGADQDRRGLVEEADGGLLFLDEVHRLPAEGQEMLFRLIDKGVYHRLGEGAERRARVMLVAATTERVDSALLRTFTRRIPMVIRLPALGEREARERLRFLRQFLREEATKIGVDLLVSPQLLQMFMEYECPGNVGQLRNDVRLACARAFLHYLTHRQAPIELQADHLPEHLVRALPPARARQPQVTELLQAYPDGFLAVNGAVALTGDEPAGEAFSFYSLLEQQMQGLQGQGLSAAAAARVVQDDIQKHFQAFLERVERQRYLQRRELATVVGHRVLAAVERAIIWAEGRLGRAISERMIYALALHVHASLQRLEQQAPANLPLINRRETAEWQVAAEMVDLLSRELGVQLPQGDVGFIYLLLQPEEALEPTAAQIGIVVVAHGQGVASGMAEVANELTGVELAQAIDMALDQAPQQVVEQLVAEVEAGRYPGGLLLLVDMGSLESIGEEVSRRTNLPVRTVSLVSSPLVIEAVHQATMPGASLDQVYHAILEGRSRALSSGPAHPGLPPVIVTCCFTGSGSALTLAQLVEEAVAGHRVEVVSTSLGAGLGWPRLISSLLQANRLLAIVGPIDPKVPGVPFVSSEEMVTGEGGRRLVGLLQGGEGPTVQPEAADAETIYDLAAVALGRHLVFTNPQASVPLIARALSDIEVRTARPLTTDVRVGLIMHMACLVERQVAQLVQARPVQNEPVHWLAEPLAELTSTFRIHFSQEQLARLDEVLERS